MNDIQIKVKYYIKGSFSHSCIEFWGKTALYCPNCGQQQVWSERTDDYYVVGPFHLCLSCEHGFHLPDDMWESPDDQGQQILKEIREHNQSTQATEGAG